MNCRTTRLTAAVIALFVALGTLMGCGSNDPAPNNDVAIGDAANEDDLLCLEQMQPDQIAELQSQVDVQAEQAAASDVQNVCVLDAGTGTVTYYTSEDNFTEYWMYALMLRRANSFLTYGLLFGDMDSAEALALALLVGIDDDAPYRPYRLYQHNQAEKTYTRLANDAGALPNVTVKQVRYGPNGQPEDIARAFSNPPRGTSPNRVPATSEDSGEISHEGGSTHVKKKSRTPSATPAAPSTTRSTAPAPAAPTTSSPGTSSTPSTSRPSGPSSSQAPAPGSASSGSSSGSGTTTKKDTTKSNTGGSGTQKKSSTGGSSTKKTK